MTRSLWWTKEAVLYVVWYLPGYLLCLLVFRVLNRTTVIGRELVPRRGGMLLMGNHLSSLDSWFIGHCLFPRPVFYPAKAELFRNPIIALLIRGWRAFPVERGKQDIATMEAIAGLARAFIVALHPTGTRSRDGSIGSGKKGAGRVAYLARTTVIPVYITGMEQVIPIGRKFPRFGKRLAIVFGAPLKLDEYYRRADTPENSQQLVNVIVAAISDLRQVLTNNTYLRAPAGVIDPKEDES